MALLAAGVDSLNTLVWQNSKDGAKGRNKPKSILEIITGNDKEEKVVAFSSAEEFEKRRKELLGI